MLLVPEPWVSRRPFELVLFVQMDSKVVAPGEALTTHMALVASYKITLMLFFMVNLHGGEGTRGEATARNVAVECRLAAVGFQVFTQVDQILTAVLAVVAAVWLLVTVAELDMVAQ